MSFEFLRTMLGEINSMMASGGVVMWPLALATILLWFGIGYRAITLKRGPQLPVREIIVKAQNKEIEIPQGFVDTAAVLASRIGVSATPKKRRRLLDDELFFLEERLSRFRVLVSTIVKVAPLAGLLGTVIGMIEMFQSLGSQTFYSQSGGVANGISKALFTTQFGLVIAIPGMIIGGLLDRRENQIQQDIEQIKEALCQEQNMEETA